MLPSNSFTEAQAAMAAQNSSHSKNLIGKTIANGTLEFVSVLGLGAYGVVYLARNLAPPPQPGSPEAAGYQAYFAVKCLNKVGLDERQRSFQRREILLHTLASKHENVVTLFGVIEEPTCIYVILQFCEEGDLFGMITETQRYLGDDELIRSVFIQILDSVDSCHRLGIYHRDLKPENILCCDDGRKVMLADFGLATSERSSSDFGCGSTFYMSPGSPLALLLARSSTDTRPMTECQGGLFQRLSSYSTLQNDVWSLGVILVNLTCGRNPWKQACPSDETFRAYLGNPDFLRSILPISDHTNRILKRIFALNPAARINLHDLRQEILAVKRFTMTDEELRNATRATKEAARAFRDSPKSPRKRAPEAVVPVNLDQDMLSSPPLSPVPAPVTGTLFTACLEVSGLTDETAQVAQALVVPVDVPVKKGNEQRLPATMLTPPSTPRKLQRPADILPSQRLSQRESTDSLSSTDSAGSSSSETISDNCVQTAARHRYQTPPASLPRPGATTVRPSSPDTPTPAPRRARKGASGRTSPRNTSSTKSASSRPSRRRRSGDESSSSSGTSSSQPHTPTGPSSFATIPRPVPTLASLPQNFISQVRIVSDAADEPMFGTEHDLDLDVDEQQRRSAASRDRGGSFTAYYPVFAADWDDVAKHQQHEYGAPVKAPMPPPVFLPPIPSAAAQQQHRRVDTGSPTTPNARSRRRDPTCRDESMLDTPTQQHRPTRSAAPAAARA